MRTSLYSPVAIGALVISLFTSIQIASAADASLPYRNKPGFVCHSYNTKNECVDFSYVDTGTTNSRLGALSSSVISSRSSAYYSNSSTYCRTGACLINARITGPERIRPGQRVFYLVTLRNESTRDRRSDVDVNFDDRFGDFVAASDEGEDDEDEINWNNILVPAQSTRYLTFELRHRGGTRYGDNVVTVDVDGSRDQTVTTVDTAYLSSLNRYDSAVCYDQYGRYNARLCADILDRQYSLDGRCDGRDSSCDISVELSGPATVVANQEVTYTVNVENDENDDVYSNIILSFDDRDMEFVRASDNDCDEEDDGTVECLDIRVREDETETLTFTFRIDSDVKSGDRLSLDVDGGGDSDDIDIRVQ